MSVRAAKMTTSFSRPLKPETMDQVTSSRDAVPVVSVGFLGNFGWRRPMKGVARSEGGFSWGLGAVILWV
jgi:hypothetical protein